MINSLPYCGGIVKKYALLRWPILVSIIIHFNVFNLSHAQETYPNFTVPRPNDTFTNPTATPPLTGNRVLSATEFSQLSSSMHKEDLTNTHTEASAMSAAESRRLNATQQPIPQPLNTVPPNESLPQTSTQLPPSQLAPVAPAGNNQVYMGGFTNQPTNPTPNVGQPGPLPAQSPAPIIAPGTPPAQENQVTTPSGAAHWNIHY